MNSLKLFRNSKLILCASVFMFIVSCTQYDINNANQNFDYSKIYFNNSLNNSLYRTTIGNRNYAILDDINEFYETEIVLPDDFLDMHLDMTAEDIKSASLLFRYASQQDLNLMDAF